MYHDFSFPVQGEAIPGEHHYLLHGCLSQLIPEFHGPQGVLRFAPINGDREKVGLLRIMEKSRLRVRVPVDHVVTVLKLAGQSLSLGEHRIRLGNPTVLPLIPAPLLAAKVVTFRNAEEPGRFLEVAKMRLLEFGIQGEPGIPITEKGRHAGEPRRQVIRIKGSRIVGFALQVAGLTAEESILLQETGLGGRTRMGCGFFLPHRARVS
jgi:CRISPR-associated endonuclease/helicase Cas3